MELNLEQINTELASKSVEEILEWTAATFGSDVAMTSSFGADSALLLQLATKAVPNIPVIFIDTGYLFPETYRFAIELTDKFKLNLHVCSATMSPKSMEANYGELWKKDLAHYNSLRKVEPLARELQRLGCRALLSGVRADQTEHRASLPIVEKREDGVYRIHPLLNWDTRRVAEYFVVNDLPYHPLLYQGYESIGDTHSTVKGAGRSGRLLGAALECGIHTSDYSI